ncbi:MAG: PEP-CTERM sorting domain-containing protein [Thermodesulfovibrionia bacterium]|nr:PEP-CTERM sorting domain-containing protein [Thermodesulfovibrionia bacterium]
MIQRKNKISILKIVAILAVCLCVMPMSAQALPINMTVTNITNNNAVDAQIGEDQIQIIVSDPFGGGNGAATQALFTFVNNGPEDSSITQIYFDDGTLFGIASVINNSYVSFKEDTPPINGVLPGGNQPTVSFSADFNVDSESGNDSGNSGVQANGVNPNEEVGILFDLINGKTIQDTIDALILGGTDPANDEALRIGLHVQGFASGGGESFVNNASYNSDAGVVDIGIAETVPEPGTIMLLGSGLIGILALRKQSKK